MSDHQPARTAAAADDRELLLAFARSGSEAAFTEIVRRHAGLVRAAARRVTGDPDMAEETAQSVFTLLARKAAAAAKSGHVAGWLHRAAVFDALRRVRAETRRRRRLAAFAEDIKTSSPAPDAPPPDPAWRETLPLLDACLQSLRENDRRALLMRWFENRGYAEIGAALGKSEEAAKKQVNRALERLRVSMGRRGASLSGASLAAVLSAAQTPAPAAAAAVTLTASSLAQAAITAAFGLSWKTLLFHSLHFMNGLKTAAAVSAILLLCAVPVLRQERAIAAVRRDLAALERATAAVPPKTFTARTASIPVSPAVPLDIEQAAWDLERISEGGLLTAAHRAAKARIDALDAPGVTRLLGDTGKLSGGGERRTLVRRLLFEELCRRDSRSALRAVAGVLRDTPKRERIHVSMKIGELLTVLMKESPEEAVKEYLALKESGAAEGAGTGDHVSINYGVFVGELHSVRPARALELYTGLDESGRINALTRMAGAGRESDLNFIMAETEKLEPGHRGWIHGALLDGELSLRGPDGAASLLRELRLSPGDAAMAAARLMRDADSVLGRGKLEVPPVNLSAADRLNWLKAQVAPEHFAAAAGLFLGGTNELFYSGEGRNGEKARVEAFRAFDWGAERDRAIAELFRPRRIPEDAGEALSLAAEITDPVMRLDTLRRLTRRFEGSPQFWRDAVNASPILTPEEREQILKP